LCPSRTKAGLRPLKKSLIREQFRETVACGMPGMRSSHVLLGPNVACRKAMQKSRPTTQTDSIVNTVPIVYKASMTRLDNQE
jgi:hypothetical protein